jgi:hypothetical protein
MNAIYFRAPEISAFWRELPQPLRSPLKQHCVASTRKIIAAIKPKLIVAIGMSTLKLFVARGNPDVVHNGRKLTRTDKIEGCPALATLHLTGAHISKEDRVKIYERIRNFLHSQAPSSCGRLG